MIRTDDAKAAAAEPLRIEWIDLAAPRRWKQSSAALEKTKRRKTRGKYLIEAHPGERD